MATKHVVKTTRDVNVWRVYRRGTDGISIELRYCIDGRLHDTWVTHTIELNFCSMTRIGEKFHTIMDELQVEWDKVKARISGDG